MYQLCSPIIFFFLVCFTSIEAAAVGVSGKFRNLTNRKLRLFWVTHTGKPHLNAYVPAWGETSFATYVPHSFFWGEIDGPEVPSTAKGVSGASFRIEEGKMVYPITDDTTPRVKLAELEDELAFMSDYYKRTGYNWINKIPRSPPIYKFRDAPEIGHREEIIIDEGARKWICADKEDPACRDSDTSLTLEVVALKPRVFRVTNFLSDFECDAIIEHSKPLMRRSTTGQGENIKVESVRTSMSARLARGSLYLADAIYHRFANVVDLPEELLTHNKISEAFNVVNYQKTQEYTPHFDAAVTESDPSRFISGLLYFNTPERGGATSFPKSPTSTGTGLRVSAEKRNLIFFYDLLEDGNFDEYSIHAGQPVEEGEKWIAAAWLWEPLNGRMGDANFLAKYKTSQHPSLFDDDGKPLKTPPPQQQEKDEL